MPYRIYRYVNCADTCRDADDIITTEMGYKKSVDDALLIANDYIKNHFFHKDTVLHKSGNNYRATDFCSYGVTICVDEIIIT